MALKRRPKGRSAERCGVQGGRLAFEESEGPPRAVAGLYAPRKSRQGVRATFFAILSMFAIHLSSDYPSVRFQHVDRAPFLIDPDAQGRQKVGYVLPSTDEIVSLDIKNEETCRLAAELAHRRTARPARTLVHRAGLRRPGRPLPAGPRRRPDAPRRPRLQRRLPRLRVQRPPPSHLVAQQVTNLGGPNDLTRHVA